jgi:hypothetical protein
MLVIIDVIFDEDAYFDTYNKKDLIKKSERKNFVQFRIYSIKSAVDYAELLNSNDEKWLNTFIQDRLMLKNRKERRSIEEAMKKSIQMNDDSK